MSQMRRVHRIGIYGYGYIHGYQRKNLWIWIWIWIWIWMGNFISTASLALAPQLVDYLTSLSITKHESS